MYNVDKFPPEIKDKRFYLWKDFMKIGKDVPFQTIQAKIQKQKPSQAAILVYTSGTTGNPKGVMLSHDNLIFAGVAQTEAMTGKIGEKHPEDRIVSYLPLSHIAGFCFDLIVPLSLGNQLYYARPDALQGTLL